MILRICTVHYSNDLAVKKQKKCKVALNKE